VRTDQIEQRQSRVQQHADLQRRLSLFHIFLSFISKKGYRKVHHCFCVPWNALDELLFASDPVLLHTLGDFAPSRWRPRAVEQRLKRSTRAPIRISSAKKALCHVVNQAESAQLPDKLLDVEVRTRVSPIDGLPHELLQQATPLAFHGENLIVHHTFRIIELEQPRSYGAPAREARALGPPEPVLHQCL
jgi:hypothetical protein